MLFPFLRGTDINHKNYAEKYWKYNLRSPELTVNLNGPTPDHVQGNSRKKLTLVFRA